MIRGYLLNIAELEKINIDENLFSSQRREKIERMKHEEDKQLSRAVELILNYGIKKIIPDITLPLSIETEESGNLLLNLPEKYEKLYFNLSHAKDYAACVISNEPVGIDVECVKTKDVEHMDKILHTQETMILSFVTNSEEKKKFFYECWVTKESYLKNLGLGLQIRPSEFAVNEENLETENKELKPRYVHIYKASEIENADWKFDASYRMAICSQKKDKDAQVVMLSAADLA